MTKQNGGWASSLAEAKARSTRNMQATSGTKYVVRPLTLDELAADEAIPDDLLRVALLEQVPGGIVAEIQEKLRVGDSEALDQARKLSQDVLQLRNRIVLSAVVAPKLKPADLAGLDPYDLTEIAAVAQHRLDVDEAGRLVDPFATFPGAGGQS